uniref:NADH-ubiquinone oxidoreductase chain 6 n=1 Tax=Pseudoclavellaria amerinae TaxID=2798532 RepID=A0A977TJL3_9HYME|nr:NADH dehydrogenase subunit 6 [Pseudoclavellaria amerinae]UXW64326.1 NADH dehydrogenase subunit 6 [Pseudoclavellaria amerinae]
MTMTLLLLLFLNSINFLMCKTPMSMGLMLLIQTNLIALNSGISSFNFWFSYIMFMIMLGGMLVMFIYVTSLTSNLKFKFNKKNILINIFLTMITMYMMNYLDFNWNLNNLNFNYMNLEMNYMLKYSLKKMLYYPNYKIMIIMINYLLLTLFIVVKIIKINKGPLRKMIN